MASKPRPPRRVWLVLRPRPCMWGSDYAICSNFAQAHGVCTAYMQGDENISGPFLLVPAPRKARCGTCGHLSSAHYADHSLKQKPCGKIECSCGDYKRKP